MRSSDKVNLIGKVRELLEENLKLRSRIMELEKQALVKEWAEEPTARETTGKILRPNVRVLTVDEAAETKETDDGTEAEAELVSRAGRGLGATGGHV